MRLSVGVGIGIGTWWRMNMKKLAIKDGTPVFAEHSLCSTCRHSHRMKGERLEQDVTICNAAVLNEPIYIKWKVTSCSSYTDTTKPTLYEMQKIAYILVEKADKVGFVPNHKYRLDNEIEKHDSIVPGD